MNFHEVLDQRRLLPLYTVKDLEECLAVGKCLVEGNLPIIEVAFRSDYAAEGIKALSSIDGLLVGAGTVKTTAQAQQAIESGAAFLVTPGLSAEVVEYAKEQNVPIVAGAVRPSEIMQANQLGLTCLKFFPADVYGGISALKALHGPFFESTFVPTGGVTLENYKEYLALNYVKAVGGSFILPKELLKAKDWQGLSSFIKGL